MFRGRKTVEGEMLALLSRKSDAGQGKSNKLRTSFSSFSAAVHAFVLWTFVSLFSAAVESQLTVKLCKQDIDPGVQQNNYSAKRTARSGPAAQYCQQFDALLILDRMSRYFTVWVFFRTLSPLLLAVGAFECSEKESLLQPVPGHVSATHLTDCLMECTGMTYIKKLQLQDNHNIRLTDSTEGDLGEYCWSTELKCTIGESFLRAYVVLPVDISKVGHELLEVKATAPTATTLLAHNNPITIADNCGLRYDVTSHFSTERVGTTFCVQVVTQEHVLGDNVLKCPPFLVTFWERKPNQSNQEGGR